MICRYLSFYLGKLSYKERLMKLLGEPEYWQKPIMLG